MRPFTQTLPFEEALRLVKTGARPIDRTEHVRLTDADGRVLVNDVTATIDVPPFDRAAMDGYAVIASDTAGASTSAPVGLVIIGQLFTGRESREEVTAGTCMEIATGAPLPAGADAVVMVEHTSVPGVGPAHPAQVLVYHPASPRQHVGPRGGDITAGHVVLKAGTTLTPAAIGVIAALGQTHVDVYAQPRVAIHCTGDEEIEPSETLGP
jgi:molybdopterin biosynthesis enzyme